MEACIEGDLATVRTLCKMVKVEHVRSAFDKTPLHYAAE